MSEPGSSALAPKHPAVAQRLRYDIRTGRFALSRKLPSNRELAAEYGVHPITIRKALRSLIDEGLLEARPHRGTFVTDQALGQAARLVEVGMIVHDFFDLSHPYVAKLFRGLADELAPQRGYMTQFVGIPAAERWRHTRFQRLRQMVDGELIQALAINARLEEREVAMLWEWGLPMVLIGRSYGQEYPRVTQDAAQAAAMLARRLVERGVRRPVLLGTVETRSHQGRDAHLLHHLIRELASAGVEVDAERDLLCPDRDDVDAAVGYRMARELLTRRPDADALVSSGTPLSMGARSLLSETGRLGREGFTFVPVTDDDAMPETEALTLPVAKLGRQAGLLLADQLRDGRERHVRTVLVPMRWLPPAG